MADIEFNPDGSIKLPERIVKQQKNKEHRMSNTQCIMIEKEVISDKAPKRCNLTITLSEKITDNRFVLNIYAAATQNGETPTKLRKITEKEHHVEIGTSFRRCTECTKLVGRYREFLDGNLILKKGNCPFEEKRNNFAYEDHFD